MKVALVSDSCEHLGLEYISGMLKSARYETKMFIDPQLFDDENISIKWLSRAFDYKKKLISHLKAYEPSLVAFSVVTDFYQWACQIAAMIKQEMDVPIIFGGIHPTSVPERVINNDFVDMVCVGEGEYPMLELVDSMQRGQIDYSIKNIWFKKNGQVIRNKVRSLIEDLDSLPMLDKDLYYSAAKNSPQCYQITASRGCVYACSYCCHSHLREIYKNKGTYFRRRSVKNVIQELKIAKERYHPRYIRFFDESIGTDIGWLREFSIQYKASIALPFLCYMHPCHVSQESVSYLKDAGCCEVEIGIQSIAEKIRRNVLCRNMSNQTIEQAIDLIKIKKINIVTDNIVGIPEQVQDDIIELARFYNTRRVNRIYIFWLRLYPNIGIIKKVKEKGLITNLQLEEALEGQHCKPFSRGGSMAGKNLVKMQFLFFVMPFLSPFVIKWIIERKIYLWFPIFIPPAILAMCTSLLSSSFNDRIVRRSVFMRYLYIFKELVRNC